MDTIDIAVIGGGAVGLAVAARLARPGRTLALLEKNERCGQETSSRNSEVVHAGLYYPPDSLKARLCVRGNALLYEYCRTHAIRHERLGKIVIAADTQEEESLDRLCANARRNGVRLERLTGAAVRALEPAVAAAAGILSPDTGIFDTHTYMQSLLADARRGEAMVSLGAEVCGIEHDDTGYVVRIKGEEYCFRTRVLINCAGLGAAAVAALAGIDPAAAGYRLHYCKGIYFRTHQPLTVRRLIYPVPDPQVHSLGIHLTPDLAGGLRFGPDAHYCDRIDYTVDETRRGEFAAAARRYLPGLEPAGLYPDTAGIRPKLQGPGDPQRDFVIAHEKSRGLDGLINLVGIDSPGLTSSLAIAEHVATLVAAIL
jgi:L-2-hydroxyglutarate oxidase LhgO